jgi:hypothetical protein
MHRRIGVQPVATMVLHVAATHGWSTTVLFPMTNHLLQCIMTLADDGITCSARLWVC